MKKYILLLVCLVGMSPIFSQRISEGAVYGLVQRLIPERVGSFVFETITSSDKLDVFEIEGKGGKIVIRGNNGVTQASGLNYYLEQFCNCQISINYNQLNLPVSLPVPDKKICIETPFKYRYIFNYCTFGYTMPWWNWERWEQMIDYLALKGINMPLAIIGQEEVWDTVYQELGLSREQLDHFFVGPAHLPWGWMGNIDGMGGPLPVSWMKKRTELQRKILDRQRSFGMTPVLQAFTGHVSKELKEIYPDAKITQIENWAGVSGTMFLDPTDPLFTKIGALYLKKQTDFFGTDHFYAADCFIEVNPPSDEPAFLSKVSESVYNSMKCVDPDAIWVLQGWFFYFKQDFWKEEQGKAFFAGIPQDRVIVLDLFGEQNPTWDKTNAFFGQPWIWNAICNEDQKVNLSGNLKAIQRNFKIAFDSEIGNNLKGIGVIPEGLGYNPVIQDFVFAKAWNPEDVNLEEWLEQYASRRYGTKNRMAQKAWSSLIQSVYARTRTMWSPLLTTPTLATFERIKEDIRHERVDFKISKNDPFAWDYDVYAFAKSAKMLLDCGQSLKDSPSYKFDLTNVFRELVHALTHRNIDALATAFEARDMEALTRAGDAIVKQLKDMEVLTGTNEHFLLGKWLKEAQIWGDTQEEKDFYNWNARTIITIWQPYESGSLRDYSGKQWNGLLSGYYLPRWELFINTLKDCIQNNRVYDPLAFDKKVRNMDFRWTHSKNTYPTKPEGDIIEEASRIWKEYESIFIPD